MAVIAFDTHQFVKTLEASGLTEQQAEGISVAVRAAHEAADLTTKSDLREMETRTDTKIDKLETGLRTEMREMEARTNTKIDKVETNLSHEISDLRKDMREIELRMTIKLGTIVVIALGAMTAISKWIA